MNNQQIAETILRQLGANRFTTTTGARQFLAIERGLQFRLPSNFARDGINSVRITLDASDTYSIRWAKIRGLNIKDCGESEGIYADQLRAEFKRKTGLDTSI